MTEIKKQVNYWDWICRILFSIVILLLISGYISVIQARAQLVSPLIPPQTINMIIADSRLYECSTGSGLFLLAGFWSYSFGKKKMAVALLVAAILVYQLLPFFL